LNHEFGRAIFWLKKLKIEGQRKRHASPRPISAREAAVFGDN